jgi:IS605 OrfB family transposase
VQPTSSNASVTRAALGVDLNANHVALSLAKHDGNLVSFGRVPLATNGLSRNQATALVGDAVKVIVAVARENRASIVLEKLDFTKKKACLRERGPRYARMLSSFAYRRFVRMLCARAHDAGILVIFVNPAYSSLIGRHKFAHRYGVSGHQAAALVLARRAQGFSERPNRQDQVALRSPARKNARHVWSFWACVAREEAGVAPHGRSRTGQKSGRDPSSAAAVDRIIPLVSGGIPVRESVA